MQACMHVGKREKEPSILPEISREIEDLLKVIENWGKESK